MKVGKNTQLERHANHPGNHNVKFACNKCKMASKQQTCDQTGPEYSRSVSYFLTDSIYLMGRGME